MARARLLKPGFFSNETLAEVPPFGRLLFAGLWTLADREGRLPDRPKWIKGALFPYENVPVNKLLDDLQAHGFILRYDVDGESFIQVLKFEKHQHVHIKESDSTIPAPVLHRASPVISQTDPSEACTTSKAEARTSTEAAGTRPVHVDDPVGQIAADFAAFGKVTAGTARAIEEAVGDYGCEWVQLAVRYASGAGFEGQPPWSYVEQQLKRWKKQKHPDEVAIDAGKPMGRNAVATQAPVDAATAIRLAYPNIQSWPELDSGAGDGGLAPMDGRDD